MMNVVNFAIWTYEMSDEKTNIPAEESPEFTEWLKKRAAKRKIVGSSPADFDERGAIFGDIENLDKSDAELFPDEIEEYTPEERRKKLKVHRETKE